MCVREYVYGCAGVGGFDIEDVCRWVWGLGVDLGMSGLRVMCVLV